MLDESNWVERNYIITCSCESDHVPVVASMLSKDKRSNQTTEMTETSILADS